MKILFSGTSSGIGNVISKKLSQKGHLVWGIARRPQKETSLAKTSCCDISQTDQILHLSEMIRQEWKNLDALVLAASVLGPVGPTLTLPPDQLMETLNTNFLGVYNCIRTFFELLTKNRPDTRAKIICFSGGGATAPRENFAAYGISKTAVVRLVETLAAEWRGLPVDINSIAPGAIATRLTDEVLELGPEKTGPKEFSQAQEIKKTGGASLDNVQGLIEFLLSQESNGISGRLLAAQWDPWKDFSHTKEQLISSDLYTLRRSIKP